MNDGAGQPGLKVDLELDRLVVDDVPVALVVHRLVGHPVVAAGGQEPGGRPQGPPQDGRVPASPVLKTS